MDKLNKFICFVRGHQLYMKDLERGPDWGDDGSDKRVQCKCRRCGRVLYKNYGLEFTFSDRINSWSSEAQ